MTSEENDTCSRCKMERDVKTSETTTINILLLGETGVGKSTFINSIANYLTYTDFKRAEEEDLLVLIPSTCEVTCIEGGFHTVKIGSVKDQNEFIAVGESATQDVRSYVFPILDGSTTIRLIDTPGIGDTRGIEQDNINYENILSYIGQLQELHAICLLFRPTNSRLTNLFDYCMFQILSRLDKSACNNIVFLITNTRGTDYSPSETLPVLQRVIRNIKANPPHADIPLDKNIFCFDNEAFRYLAAVKQGVGFTAKVKEKYKESWEKSVDQCCSLITYIVGDAENRPLTPHTMKNTTSINEARRMVLQLSKPLADITHLIHINIRALDRHQELIDSDTNSLEELREKLYMPIIKLDVQDLSEPMTVCTDKDCAEIYKVDDMVQWHYKKPCHNPCYLKNVPQEIIGSPQLASCDAINKETHYCLHCSHIFSVHMHIYYMTNTKADKAIDPNIQLNMDTKENIIEHTKELIASINRKKNELEREHDIIINYSARFAHFLQKNAITPLSDSYKEYIEYLIIQEKSHPVSDKERVSHLENILKEYEEAKKMFDQVLAAPEETESYISPQNILDSIQDLYALKHNGDILKQLYECQKNARKVEYEINTEYIHRVVPKQPKKKGKQRTGTKTRKEVNRKQKHDHNKTFKENTEGQIVTENSQRETNISRPPSYENVRRLPFSSEPNCPDNSPTNPWMYALAESPIGQENKGSWWSYIKKKLWSSRGNSEDNAHASVPNEYPNWNSRDLHPMPNWLEQRPCGNRYNRHIEEEDRAGDRGKTDTNSDDSDYQ